MKGFECHITTQVRYADRVNAILPPGWKTSEIKRDPLLGDASYFYLTTHGQSWELIYHGMVHLRERLRLNDIPVLREKIELIIHDVRF